MKLPKQWPRWMERAGLKYTSRYKYEMVGRGRRWRVSCHGDFQCSCPIEHFDRWANSFAAGMMGVPSTEEVFIVAANLLIAESEDKR